MRLSASEILPDGVLLVCMTLIRNHNKVSWRKQTSGAVDRGDRQGLDGVFLTSAASCWFLLALA